MSLTRRSWSATPAETMISGPVGVNGRPVHVAFVDDTGREVPVEEIRFVRTAAYPA